MGLSTAVKGPQAQPMGGDESVGLPKLSSTVNPRTGQPSKGMDPRTKNALIDVFSVIGLVALAGVAGLGFYEVFGDMEVIAGLPEEAAIAMASVGTGLFVVGGTVFAVRMINKHKKPLNV